MANVDLQALCSQVDAATKALSLAQRALDEDKQIRSKSLWAGFVGVVWPTAAKLAVKEAESSLSTLNAHVEREVIAWIKASAWQAIKSDPTLATEREQYRSLVTEISARKHQVDAWLEAADKAYNALRSAASKCRSAATMDTIDAFCSESKFMDAMAYSETSSARTAANNASKALSELVEMLPTEAKSVQFDAPDGLLGLVVGLSDMPTLDFFLELSNASKLSRVAKECDNAAGELSPLRDRLKAMLTDVDESVKSATATLEQFDLRFLETAYAAVPEPIRGAMPSSLEQRQARA